MLDSISFITIWILLSIIIYVDCDRLTTLIPSYYIDMKLLRILGKRSTCMNTLSGSLEIVFLRNLSASEYYRSHELYGHIFFIESINNPYRSFQYEQAEFEYIPLLSLYWISNQFNKGFHNKKSYNIHSANRNTNCSYTSLIQDIIITQNYLVNRDRSLSKTNKNGIIPKFSIASTYNMRTIFGTGMPTQIRRGSSWDTVSAFIMSISLGHYERWPECPDLLRKSWKYIVELPYIAMNTQDPYIDSIAKNQNNQSNIACTINHNNLHMKHTINKLSDDEFIYKTRKYTYHFSGSFDLFGPELICSVRNAIIEVSNRLDIIVVNTTKVNANSKVNMKLNKIIQDSVFCLVIKSDSYSTSFFYHALSEGCIPIVISDCFPWIIPYDEFVIRINEQDFVKNPNYVLDYLKETIGRNNYLLIQMRQAIFKYKGLFSYEMIPYNSIKHKKLLDFDIYSKYHPKKNLNNKDPPSTSSATTTTTETLFNTIVPLELLLLELRYIQAPHQYYNNIPCLRPYMCYHQTKLIQSILITNPSNNTSSVYSMIDKNDSITDYIFYESQAKKRTFSKVYSIKTPNIHDYTQIKTSLFYNYTDTSHYQDLLPGYEVKNDGYQVRALRVPNKFHFYNNNISSNNISSSNNSSNSFNINVQIADTNGNNNKITVLYEDLRTHLCRHNTRLIGMYKIVFYMQCIRILWPLQPGKFKPVDNITPDRFTTPSNNNNNNNNNNMTLKNNPNNNNKLLKKKSTYKYDPDGINIEDMNFVMNFHSIKKPSNWLLTNYPISLDRYLNYIYTLDNINHLS